MIVGVAPLGDPKNIRRNYMENASKALLMAGGVLIAIITIALLARSFSSIGMFQKAQLSEEEQAQLVAFNEQYTKYLNQYVYGTEVRTLINKYKNDGLVEVLPENLDTTAPHGVGEDTKYYKCTAIGYDNSTGRVNSITFEEVTISQPE